MIDLFFEFSFFQRALLAGVFVALIGAVVGIFVTLRKESFISEAVAHASLAGVALAFLISAQPLWLAMAVGVLMAVGITYVREKTTISMDVIIGIFFSILFAAGIVILSMIPGYTPELTTYLFGSILSVSWFEVIIQGLLLVLIVFLWWRFYRELLFVTFDPEAAKLRGIPVRWLEYAIRIVVALMVVVSIKAVGIVLVTALLVIPASAAKLKVKSFNQMIPVASIFSIIGVFLGLIGSYFLDVPSGAMVVLLLGGMFFVWWLAIGLWRRIRSA